MTMRAQRCNTTNLKKVLVDPNHVQTFKDLYRLQMELIEKISIEKLLDLDQCIIGQEDLSRKYRWLEHMIDAMHNELEELRDWLPWKTWKTYKGYDFKKVEMEVKYEAIDLLHFLLEIFMILRISPEELVKLYQSKNRQNHKRQERKY